MITVLITIIECVLLLIFTSLLMWMYAAKDRTPMYVRVLTVIGWFLGLSIILFIPLDIYLVTLPILFIHLFMNSLSKQERRVSLFWIGGTSTIGQCMSSTGSLSPSSWST